MPINSQKDAYFLRESPTATNYVKHFQPRYTLHALHLYSCRMRQTNLCRHILNIGK